MAMRETRYPGVFILPDGRYLIDATGVSAKTGKRKRKRKTVTASSASEAARLREELRANIESVAETRRVRLAEYAESWFASRAPALKPSTADRYARSLDTRILPGLGDHFVDAIEPADVVRWRDAQTGKPRSVNSHLRVLRTLLADAADELGVRNPAARVRALREPKRASENEANRLTAPELRAMLEHLRTAQPRSWAMIIVQAFTGMRFGEVAGLRWEDVDESEGVIRVRRSVWLGRVDETKTGAERTVPMAEVVAEVLREHRRQLFATQAPGVAEGWCFRNKVGGFPYNSTLNDHLRAAIAATGITRPFSSHGLRRTLNNLARQVSTGEVVRSIVGHSTERMTEHYSWVELSEKQTAIDRVLRLVEPSADGCDTSSDTPTPRSEKAG